VHLRFHGLITLFIAAGLSAAVAAQGQSPAAVVETPAPQSEGGAASSTATLHGHVADPTGALIPGAKITILTADCISVESGLGY
jgi:hypothetical protein